MAKDKMESYFDGGLFQLVCWKIFGFLLTICTLGICYPWALCLVLRWETKHTIIDGKRLCFDGHAVQLFAQWIKWLLLFIITITIYGWWIPIKTKKWVTKHTHYK